MKAEKELKESLRILLFNLIEEITNNNYRIDIIMKYLDDAMQEIKAKTIWKE